MGLPSCPSRADAGFSLRLAACPPFSPGLSHPGFPSFQTKELRGVTPYAGEATHLEREGESTQGPSAALPSTVQGAREGAGQSPQGVYPCGSSRGPPLGPLPDHPLRGPSLCLSLTPQSLSPRASSPVHAPAWLTSPGRPPSCPYPANTQVAKRPTPGIPGNPTA